jgi:hypothetical protein
LFAFSFALSWVDAVEKVLVDIGES